MIIKEQVFEYLRTVPYGKVVTYGQIAEHFGNKKAARAVGNMLHQNPDMLMYPCYKVVNSRGRLSKNYVFGGIEIQKELLEKEGIEVVDYTVDLEKYGIYNNIRAKN